MKMLMIGWDAADWQHIDPLLEQGQMPNLAGMIADGVRGNLATLEPVLSPMLWNSIATGKLAHEHGILGFTEPDPVNGGSRPCASTSRKVKAIWNILNQEGYTSQVTNWWASHPAEPIRGCIVSNSYVHAAGDPEGGYKHLPGTFHPESLGEEVGPLRMHPSELNEWDILPFIPNAAEIDQEKDKLFTTFATQLCQAVSIHNATTWMMENKPWDFAATYLEAVDHFCHGFMPYAPPKMSVVSEEDFEMYKGVIDGIYRFSDMMLGRLLGMVPEDTTVLLCSDHGFQSGSGRPKFTPNEPAGPAYWHRPLGVFAMKGPGIRKGGRVYGATLLDIAPTILHHWGLPVGQDMPGRALLDIYEDPAPLNVIPSWEDVEGEDGQFPEGQTPSAESSAEMLKQFVALGYIEDPGEDKEVASRKAAIENEYNLARVHMSANHPHEAMPLMQKLVAESPWENRFILRLAKCYQEGGYFQAAIDLLEKAYPMDVSTPPAVKALMGRCLFSAGKIEEGQTLLETARNHMPSLGGVHLELARTYQRGRRWGDVIASCEQELKLTPTSAPTMQVMSAALLRLSRNEEAREWAQRSIDLVNWNPKAYYALGIALARLKQTGEAIEMLQAAAAMEPNMTSAHRVLARLLKNSPERMAESIMHVTAAQQSGLALANYEAQLRTRAQERFEVADIPPYIDRVKKMREERPRGKKEEEPSGKTFLLVSGLPRSGTSLMMQMLEAGGMPPKTDGEREADRDNPRGYYEWEAIKQIAKRPELMDEEGLDGKPIKVISMLLSRLPQHHNYKVLFMLRPVEEIAASQAKMIDRLGTSGAALDIDALAKELTVHRDTALGHMRRTATFKCKHVSYSKLLEDPAQAIASIREFIGEDLLPNVEAMATVIDPTLYRNRQQEEKPTASE